MVNIREKYGEDYYDKHVRIPNRLIYNPINNPINHPINNPLRFFDSFGKRKNRKKTMLPRNGICEVCGVSNSSKRQIASHHIAHDAHIADEAVLEVWGRCHENIEGQGSRYTLWVMEFGGVI